LWRVPADHVRRRRGPGRAWAEAHLRRGQGGAGPRRFSGARGAAATGPQGASRQGRGGRLGDASAVRRTGARLERGKRQDMQIGMVGLGRMGGNMARRLMRGGHEVVAYATDPAAVKQISSEGATGVSTLDDLVARLAQPRTAWVMVPAGEATEQVVMELAKRMSRGDVIIDGGNSFYKDDVRRKKMVEPQGIH